METNFLNFRNEVGHPGYGSDNFFAIGRVLVDIDIADSDDYNKQIGLGAIMGIGAKYDFTPGLSVFVNPYSKVHSLLSFTMENNHKRLANAVIRLGVMYNF